MRLTRPVGPMTKCLAFLGPSRPAQIPSGITVLPPARQGDVWRALERKPAAIALIDGTFEHQPSVWHREILDALAAGVRVFGASSMGALRAAELKRYGMVPVGAIARGYASGPLNDDADVALLHADATHGFRPLTVPMVDARHAIALAAKKKVLSPREARRALACAEAMHYSERTWGRLTREAGLRSERWLAFVKNAPSLKVMDATLCLDRLVRVARPSTGSGRTGIGRGSSFQRRMRAIALGKTPPEPARRDLAAAGRLAADLGINPALDPSGLRGFAHRLLNDGLLRLDR
jgi:hypothetical protein